MPEARDSPHLPALSPLAGLLVAVLSPEETPHPVLSAGFTLIGSDVKLNSPSSLIGQALTEILQHPERARDALRVLLHLVRASGTLWGAGARCR